MAFPQIDTQDEDPMSLSDIQVHTLSATRVPLGTIVGTPEQVTERLRTAIELGAHGVIVHLCDAPRPEGTWLFAERVAPEL